MDWLRTFGSRVFGLFCKHNLENDLDTELRAHLESLTEENVRRGMTPEEARYAARREFGGFEQTKELYRKQRALPFSETLAQDLRYALRMLLKSPSFTLVTVLTLALGIGANTAIFSLINSVILGSLRVRQPGELVVIKYSDPLSGRLQGDFSYPMYQAMRDGNAAFSGVLTRSGVDFNVTYAGQSEWSYGELVSGNYFETLGVQPFLGRLISSDDDRLPGTQPVAVLSSRYWRSRFGSDPFIVGKQILLNGHPMTVIGVAPAGFYGTEIGSDPDIRVPMMMATVFKPVPANRMQSPRHRWITVMARRKPEVGVSQAEAALDTLYRQVLSGELGAEGSGVSAHEKQLALSSRIRLTPGDQGFAHLRDAMERPLLLMFSVAGIVLLVACANLANLLLARNAKRKREIAVRLAIGAGRGRLVRQWLTESLLLGMLGGCAGVAVAYWTRNALIGFLPAQYSPNVHAPLDLRVLAFALFASLLTGLLVGLAPALQLSQTGVSAALRNDAPSLSPGERLFSLRSTLIFLQVALSFPLLIGAGLFLHSLSNLRGVDMGFMKENVFLARLNPSLNGYPTERIRSLYNNLLERVRALPGVRGASLTTTAPISGGWDQLGVKVEGHQPRQDENVSPNAAVVSPGYFGTLGIPFVAGRDFSEEDTANRTQVVIVNEMFSRYFFGDTSPIGKRMTTNDNPDAPLDMEIVGVVRDAKYVTVDEKPRRHFYTSIAQEPRLSDMTLQVRTSSDAEKIKDLVRAQLHDLDPNLPLYAMTTLEIQIDESLTAERLLTWLSTLFGFLATLLASIGLSGVVGFTVARRTREIGIRMALGAAPTDILRAIVSRMALLVAAGILVGLAAGLGLSRVMSSMLYEVRPADPLAFVGAGVILSLVAVLAAYLPARRATRVDPVIALRYE
jgi:predicted permease